MTMKELFNTTQERLNTVTHNLSYSEFLSWAIVELKYEIGRMVNYPDFYEAHQQEAYKYRSKAIEFYRANLREINGQ